MKTAAKINFLPIKKGIDYYAMDVSFIRDPKIRLLKRRFGADGVWVYLCLISDIYENEGYYIDLSTDDKLELFASERANMTTPKVMTMINYMRDIDLFSSEKWEAYKILTSKRVQQNYIFATRERRRAGRPDIKLIQEYLVIEIKGETNIKIISFKNGNLVCQPTNEVCHRTNADLYAEQSLKKRKEKEIKENNMSVNNLQETPRALNEDDTRHTLNLFISRNHPSILQIPEQMTYDECEIIAKTYSRDIVKLALVQLDNKPKDKYLRVFNTLKTFCDFVKKPINTPAYAQSVQSQAPTKPAPRAISCEEAAAIQEAKRKKQLEEQDGGEKIDISELIAKTFSKNGKMHAAERS